VFCYRVFSYRMFCYRVFCYRMFCYRMFCAAEIYTRRDIHCELGFENVTVKSVLREILVLKNMIYVLLFE